MVARCPRERARAWCRRARALKLSLIHIPHTDLQAVVLRAACATSDAAVEHILLFTTTRIGEKVRDLLVVNFDHAQADDEARRRGLVVDRVRAKDVVDRVGDDA